MATWGDFKAVAEGIRRADDHARKAGLAPLYPADVSEFSLRMVRGELRVSGPYHSEFRRRARRIGGQWQRDITSWCFPGEARDTVLALIRLVFGVTPKMHVYGHCDHKIALGRCVLCGERDL